MKVHHIVQLLPAIVMLAFSGAANAESLFSVWKDKDNVVHIENTGIIHAEMTTNNTRYWSNERGEIKIEGLQKETPSKRTSVTNTKYKGSSDDETNEGLIKKSKDFMEEKGVPYNPSLRFGFALKKPKPLPLLKSDPLYYKANYHSMKAWLYEMKLLNSAHSVGCFSVRIITSAQYRIMTGLDTSGNVAKADLKLCKKEIGEYFEKIVLEGLSQNRHLLSPSDYNDIFDSEKRLISYSRELASQDD